MKEVYEVMASRRHVVLGSVGMAVAWGVSPPPVLAQGSPTDVRSLLTTLIGDATPSEGKISLELPEIAENGNTIPFTVRVESPMTEADFVRAVHILAPANPHPRVGSFFFTPHSGKAAVSSRMRLAQTQDVLAVAEMSDGTFNTGKRTVKVTVGGCGG